MSAPAVNHPLFARFYARVSPALERGGMAERRRQLLADLSGEVVEVGAGSGASFAHYPPAVTRVVAVEPEPRLRALAQAAAATAPVPVEVTGGVAEQLELADRSFDAAVAVLVLCTVADQPAALAELHRVVRPGGQLRFLEHVRAQRGGLARVQRALDATLWPAVMGGCHTSRDTVAAIGRAGFAVDRLDRFHFPEARLPLPTSPHAAGVAVRSDGGGRA